MLVVGDPCAFPSRTEGVPMPDFTLGDQSSTFSRDFCWKRYRQYHPDAVIRWLLFSSAHVLSLLIPSWLILLEQLTFLLLNLSIHPNDSSCPESCNLPQKPQLATPCIQIIDMCATPGKCDLSVSYLTVLTVFHYSVESFCFSTGACDKVMPKTFLLRHYGVLLAFLASSHTCLCNNGV